MNFLKFAVLITPMLAATSVARAAQTQMPASKPLIKGDFKLVARGQIRRLLVLNDRAIAYDIWRATPIGIFEHRHFTLTSPSASPIESSDYAVIGDGAYCGHISLRMFYRNGRPLKHPAVILVTYGTTTQPFGSFDEPASPSILKRDEAMVARTLEVALTPGFYDSPNANQRDDLAAGIPVCNSARTAPP